MKLAWMFKFFQWGILKLKSIKILNVQMTADLAAVIFNYHRLPPYAESSDPHSRKLRPTGYPTVCRNPVPSVLVFEQRPK